MPGCDGTGMAKRSYPASEVGGNGREEIPCVGGQGQRPRRATPCPRPGSAPEAKGSSRKEQPHGRGQGSDPEQQPTPKARAGSRDGQPNVQGVVAVRAQQGLEGPSQVEGQKGQRKEIPLIWCALLEQR